MISVTVSAETNSSGATVFTLSPANINIGAQLANNVDTMTITLPSAWSSMTVRINLKTSSGITYAYICTSGVAFEITSSMTLGTSGEWWLDATDGTYHAYSQVGTYQCYFHPGSGTTPEPTPSEWEQFVSDVQSSANAAASSATAAAASATAAQNVAQQVAKIESSTTASQAYAIGDFLVLSSTGLLYKVTAAIASGGTITPGTNCTATTAGTQIAAINNNLTNQSLAITKDDATFNEFYVTANYKEHTVYISAYVSLKRAMNNEAIFSITLPDGIAFLGHQYFPIEDASSIVYSHIGYVDESSNSVFCGRLSYELHAYIFNIALATS